MCSCSPSICLQPPHMPPPHAGVNFNPLYGMLDPRYSPPEELIMPLSECCASFDCHIWDQIFVRPSVSDAVQSSPGGGDVRPSARVFFVVGENVEGDRQVFFGKSSLHQASWFVTQKALRKCIVTPFCVNPNFTQKVSQVHSGAVSSAPSQKNLKPAGKSLGLSLWCAWAAADFSLSAATCPCPCRLPACPPPSFGSPACPPGMDLWPA